MTDKRQRRFAPMRLWTLPGCGKPRTATKNSKNESVLCFPRALGKPANGRRFSTAPTGLVIRITI
jgi:hypothetical protein